MVDIRSIIPPRDVFCHFRVFYGTRDSARLDVGTVLIWTIFRSPSGKIYRLVCEDSETYVSPPRSRASRRFNPVL